MFFWIVIISIILFLFLCRSLTNNKMIKNICVILISMILIVLLGLRKTTMGLGDVENIYLPIYKDYILGKSYFFIIDILKDPLFYCCVKFLSTIYESFQFVLIIYACIFVTILMKFIFKESQNLAISVVTFMALNFFGTAFSGLRHMISLVIILLAYFPYKERDIKKFLILVGISAFFHVSAISFLCVYIMDKMFEKINNKMKICLYNVFLIVVFVFMQFFGENLVMNLFKFIINTLNLERFKMYTENGYSSLNNLLFIINYFILFFTSLIYCKIKIKDEKKERKYGCLLTLQFLGTLFCCFTGVLGEFNRIAMFFTIFSIILLPEGISYIKKGKERFFLETVVVGMLVIYFICFGIYNYNLVPFQFFWN